MVKSSKDQIEQNEIKVLNVLENNSRDNIDKIAKSCGFSRQKVWRIIRDLEKRKAIWGYSAVTDGTVRNFKHFVFMVARNNVPFDKAFRQEVIFEKIDDYAPDSAKIEDIYYTNGKYDAIITFYSPDLINAKLFINEVFRRIGKYLGDYLLLETLFPVRKQGFKNPQIKELSVFL